MSIVTLSARWILPITSPPIQQGAISIRDGRIESIGPIKNFSSQTIESLDDAIILPGLVNAHTHLELSHLQGLIRPTRDFPEWLMEILASQKKMNSAELKQQIDQAIRKGVQESLDSGTTTVGDISRFSRLTRPLLKSGPLRVISFGEVLGLGTRRHLIDERLLAAQDQSHDSPSLSAALSPHAPYSLEENGYKKVVHQARQLNMRTCMHLAETVEEIQFLQTGQGRFREMLEETGIWDSHIAIPRVSPVRWVCGMGLLGPECLVAHGNYVDEEEIDLLCATGTSVAYCPRTHHYFGHENYPLLAYLGGGVNACVGTDSLASNPSLSVLDELREIHRQYPELPAQTVLALGTINGARALGMAREVGSLEPGKKADLAIFSLITDSDKVVENISPEQQLLRNPIRLARLYIDGQRIR